MKDDDADHEATQDETLVEFVNRLPALDCVNPECFDAGRCHGACAETF